MLLLIESFIKKLWIIIHYDWGDKNIMSNRDRTGPKGKGPRTGRGKGKCPKPKSK